MKNKGSVRQSGFGVVEVVIGATILSVVFMALFSFFFSALKVARHTTEMTQVSFLLDEGIEVVKLLRDESWSANIATATTSDPYIINFSANKWEITTGSDIIGGTYHRTVRFEDVYRDANDDIATSGTLDPGTREVSIEIEWWDGGATSTESTATYITDLFGN